jgi:uncharacterized protein YndB with AHSA1/START domain
MADIFHDLSIEAPIARVFDAISTPRGLDAWWTKRSSGTPEQGREFELWFGPDYDWRAVVTVCRPHSEFELRITRADNDWMDSRIGFVLEEAADRTRVYFCHLGWPVANEHWRVSCYCWAMYLRILRRHLEHGEFVPYENRLDA